MKTPSVINQIIIALVGSSAILIMAGIGEISVQAAGTFMLLLSIFILFNAEYSEESKE